jgi:hypothetical protein
MFFFTDNLRKIIDPLLFRKLVQAAALLVNLMPTIPSTFGYNAVA